MSIASGRAGIKTSLLRSEPPVECEDCRSIRLSFAWLASVSPYWISLRAFIRYQLIDIDI
jgi:hypothetical protein